MAAMSFGDSYRELDKLKMKHQAQQRETETHQNPLQTPQASSDTTPSSLMNRYTTALIHPSLPSISLSDQTSALKTSEKLPPSQKSHRKFSNQPEFKCFDQPEFKYLFDLPLEIRERIYEFALDTGRCYYIIRHNYKPERCKTRVMDNPGWTESALNKWHKEWHDNPDFERVDLAKRYNKSTREPDFREWNNARRVYASHLSLNLLLTCKQIYSEACLFPFKYAIFRVHDWETLWRLVGSVLRPWQAAAMESIYLDMDMDYVMSEPFKWSESPSTSIGGGTMSHKQDCLARLQGLKTLYLEIYVARVTPLTLGEVGIYVTPRIPRLGPRMELSLPPETESILTDYRQSNLKRAVVVVSVRDSIKHPTPSHQELVQFADQISEKIVRRT
ncbi:hypothetical protein K490DRAFT_55209 [Saccharata proteae CBS 121410]|uniref:DUF7730 domain-containing protein n=1 Tax=Saccharata proteae CBS 121410 TaxID=1314787 RepID=A0A6A5YDM9_9PEZI|nr:hypothetical protein K490DRAFT_55209 [Saccharata proteae CBS 121410]